MCEIELFQVINLDQKKKKKMVLITSLDAKSLSFSSAAVRNLSPGNSGHRYQ